MNDFNSNPRESYYDRKLFRQECSCDASHTPFQYTSQHYHYEGKIKVFTHFYTMPSCDKCGTPWKEVHD